MNDQILPITMTSKGTFTLPAKVRKDFGLNKKGDKLLLRFRPGRGHVTLQAPTTIADISAMQAKVAKLIPPHLRNLPLDMNQVREQKHAEYYRDHFA